MKIPSTPIWQKSSPGRFAWMLVPEGGERPCGKQSPSYEEFEAACEFALASWQALPVIAPNLFHWGKKKNLKTEAAERVKDRLTSIHAFANVSRKVSDRFLQKLENDNIPYVVVKGSAIQVVAHEAPLMRIGKDIDIAVSSSFLRRAENTAIESGFFPAQWSEKTKRFYLADPAQRAAVESKHYELGFLARRQIVQGLSDEEQSAIRREIPRHYLWHETASGDLACYCCVDIHHGLSLDISSKYAVQSRRLVNSNGGSFWVPALEWLLLHTIYKIYWEGVYTYNKGGYQFSDLAALITRADSETLMRLFDLLEMYELEAGGFYVLRRLYTDLHMVLPPEIETFLELTALVNTRADSMPMNDLGDMWPKLWGHR